GPSVFALIGNRAELELSSHQIEALDSIGEWLARTNSPIDEQLRRMGVAPFSPGPAMRGGRMQIPEEAEPLREQIRQNNRQAMTGVGEQLTPEQKQRICERRERRPVPGAREGRGGRGSPEARRPS